MSLLYDYQEGLKVGFMKVTSRSIKYFGFLGENLNGRTIWYDSRHTIYGVTKKKAEPKPCF